MNNIGVILCAIILIAAIAGAIYSLVTYVINKRKNGDTIIEICMKLANDLDIIDKVTSILKDIHANDYNTAEEYITYFKSLIKKELYDFAIKQYPEFNNIVTEKNIDTIVEFILPLINLSDSKLTDDFDKTIMIEETEEVKEE